MPKKIMDDPIDMTDTIIVHMKWDFPYKSAGILVINTNDERKVLNLLKRVRKKFDAGQHFATPALYRVIKEVFEGKFDHYVIAEVGKYRIINVVM